MLLNRYDLEMVQGATFLVQVNIQDSNSNPVPLANCTANLAIRTSYSNNLVTTTLSTSNGEITLGSNAGVYLLSLPPVRTAAIAVNTNAGSPPSSQYVYDLVMTYANGFAYNVMSGRIQVWGSVAAP